MRFVTVGRNTVSMRRYRNIHCAKLNAIIQKGEPIKGTIISKKLVNMVLDLGYGIRALLPIDKRYQKVIFQQFQIGDIILVHRTKPIDAFYMNQVGGYRFFSLHTEIRMVVGRIVKFVRKGYKSFITVVLGVNEFISVECESTSHIYYGPGHYVILKRDEMGNFFLYKSLEKQYVSFSYIPQANTSTIFSDQYQYNISYAHSETIPMGKLMEVQPTCAYSLAPGNLFYCAIKSLGSVESVTLPDFTGQPVNIGIDFCKRHGLTSPHIEYIPIEDSISDENYIRVYGSRKSRKQIEFELRDKGLDREDIGRLLEEQPVDEREQILKHLRKKGYEKGVTPPKERARIAASLARKGFSFDEIYGAMEEYPDS